MDAELESSQDSRISDLWASLDTHSDGLLNAKSLKDGLHKIDHPLKNADRLLDEVIKKLDTNHDGNIDFNEFSQFMKHAETHLWHLFKSIDTDHNNQLSREELRNAFANAGITVSDARLQEFFENMDADHDGTISFDEWRDFLLFIPTDDPGLGQIISYVTTTLKLSSEGDVIISSDTAVGLGTLRKFLMSTFGIFYIISSPPIRHRPPDTASIRPVSATQPQIEYGTIETAFDEAEEGYLEDRADIADSTHHATQGLRPVLTALMPNSGYFMAGAIAGIVSRTSTAPLDRLKVYLIAQTGSTTQAVAAAKRGAALQATRHATRPLVDACKDLWRAGGIRSLFAGNGLNVLKVMPESAIKFGSYEASKRAIAHLEGHGDPQKIHPFSRFIAGGLGGMGAQFCVYPIDTLKFRMQCETVEGGEHGNRLIIDTAKKMWRQNGFRAYYRGLSMGLLGMFPYAALDLGTFEALKSALIRRNMQKYGMREEDAAPGSIATAFIGGFSGALGASIVYPLNVLRTRLQTQGTIQHSRTYTGIADVWRQTISNEGYRGLFKGLTPNLLKVVPAVSITYVTYENSKKLLHLA